MFYSFIISFLHLLGFNTLTNSSNSEVAYDAMEEFSLVNISNMTHSEVIMDLSNMDQFGSHAGYLGCIEEEAVIIRERLLDRLGEILDEMDAGTYDLE